VIVDCLTVWLSNLVCAKDADVSPRETQALLDALSSLAGDCILISNEVGFGIIPANALARRFGDEAGVLHQRVAARCDRVILMVAGLPLAVKGSPGISGPGVPP
jgi:adenosylcobinamide kinase/adenosylcobinamide-phosphate guanylyltransferase